MQGLCTANCRVLWCRVEGTRGNYGKRYSVRLRAQTICRSPLQETVEPVEVVDDAPVATAFLHFVAPGVKSSEIFAGIEVISAKLGDIECDDVESLEIQSQVITHVALGELFLQVGENEDFLASRVLFPEELDRL